MVICVHTQSPVVWILIAQTALLPVLTLKTPVLSVKLTYTVTLMVVGMLPSLLVTLVGQFVFNAFQMLIALHLHLFVILEPTSVSLLLG